MADNLILEANEVEHSKLNLQLCDATGKQISQGQKIAKQTQINTTSLAT
jgi:hypothetical protein